MFWSKELSLSYLNDNDWEGEKENETGWTLLLLDRFQNTLGFFDSLTVLFS
jgi:hypothetical protein